MTLKIRLARFGRRHAPFYNIVVAHARTARNSKPLEVLGTYDPIPKKSTTDTQARLYKDIQLDVDRARYWLGVGAQPSEPMLRLLTLAGLMEDKYGSRRPAGLAKETSSGAGAAVEEADGQSAQQAESRS